ncbi:uncharacterized protein LODBEIA_P04810 [Lodderomyces beijingensis]|uniref:PIG-P domain-containing protein n=1 Tax=Lodderomyces beijingensis TaxID=1775926 RepID=A0ABP0ZJA6_9ASCO
MSIHKVKRPSLERSTSLKPNLAKITTSSSSSPISSDDEHNQDTSSIESSPQTAKQDNIAKQSDPSVSTLTRSHRSSAEYRGFTIYVLSTLVLLMYIAWTLLPPPVLHQLGVDYYPDKYWSVVIPAWFLMAMLFAFVAMALYCGEVLTLPLSDLHCFVDDAAQFLVVEDGDDDGEARRKGVVEYVYRAPSGVWDLPVNLVNEVLYLDNDDN